MKIESYDAVEERRRWKVVRADTYADVPGHIITADEARARALLPPDIR